MKLVISLLTYNSAAYLEYCLASIGEQSILDVELVCRDNHSSDASVALIRRTAPTATVIESPKNEGFSRGHNETIRETVSDYICILNPDLILDTEYLSACVSFLDAHPRVGAVSGLLVRASTLTELPEQGIIDSSGIGLSPTGRTINKDAGRSVPSVAVHPTAVLGVSATAAVYRRAALEDIALESDGRCEYFDEDFFMYKEDVDLALRLALRGWEAATLWTVRAFHIRSTTAKLFVRPSPLINRLSYRNHWFVLIKCFPRRLLLLNALFIVVFECAKCIYLLVREPSTLGAVADVWKLFKKMIDKRAHIMKRQTTRLTPNP